MKKILIVVMLVSLATVVRAEIFDFQGPGGRAIALGGAYTGLVSGAEGIVWNPGATGFGDSHSYAFFYANPLGLLKHVNAALVGVSKSTKGSTVFAFGPSYHLFGSAGEYTETEAALNVSMKKIFALGAKLLEFGVGGNVKYMMFQVEETESDFGLKDILARSAIGADIGVKIEANPVFLGLSLRNVNKPVFTYIMKASGYDWTTLAVTDPVERSIEVKPVTRFGAGIKTKYATACFDADSARNLGVGVEVSVNVLRLRYGFQKNAWYDEGLTDVDLTGVIHNFGIGLNMGGAFNLDLGTSLIPGMYDNMSWSGSVSGKF
jgi:hypothetical protein